MYSRAKGASAVGPGYETRDCTRVYGSAESFMVEVAMIGKYHLGETPLREGVSL